MRKAAAGFVLECGYLDSFYRGGKGKGTQLRNYF